MTVQAAVATYRAEMVRGFEASKSDLASIATTKETMRSGLTATFLIGTSGGATAVTRGQNGLIPYGQPANTQVTATLVEKHAPFELTGFDIFASQGNQKQHMQDSSYAVIRRDMDDVILAELANATQDVGSGTFTLANVLKAVAVLGQNDVPIEEENNMFGTMTPAMWAYAMQLPTFTSGDYVDMKPLTGPARKMWRWAGVNWIRTSRVSGMGTATELAYIWHRNALGYAVNMGEENIHVGYDEKQDVSWSRATVFHAAKILQNSGIIKFTHDGSGIVAT
jgi:hypothetical protein